MADYVLDALAALPLSFLRAQQKLRAWQKELFPDHWVMRCLLLGSLGFTLFIAFYCFHAEPHFLDEGTYIFPAPRSLHLELKRPYFLWDILWDRVR